MEKYSRQRLENIQEIFEKQTGVQIEEKGKRAYFGAGRTAMVLCTAICFLAMSAFAYSRFSDMAGDEAAFYSVYKGDGVFEITVTNLSGRELKLQEQVKLMRWSTAGEVEGNPEQIEFQNVEIAPHSEGVIRIDLSKGYNIAELEKPLPSGDWYYFVLTNNDFAFGQDWMCDLVFDRNASGQILYKPSAEEKLGEKETDEANEKNEANKQETVFPSVLRFGDWAWPTESETVSVPFGKQENGTLSDHINIAGNKGDAVYSTADGTVAETGFDVTDGNYILIDMGDGITAKYGHLKEILTEAGTQVTKGQKIGELGATGMAAGPNLSFAVYLDGEAVNPLAE